MSPQNITDVDRSRWVDFDEVQKCLGDHDFVIVDVRQPAELQCEGRIQGTINVPLGDVASQFGGGAAALAEKLGRPVAEDGSNVIFHCRIGGRATRAALAADKFGFTKSRVYKGSLKDWMKKGGAVSKESAPL